MHLILDPDICRHGQQQILQKYICNTSKAISAPSPPHTHTPKKEHGLVTRCGGHMAHVHESFGTIRMKPISPIGRSNHSEMMDKCLVLLTFWKKIYTYINIDHFIFKPRNTAQLVIFSNSLLFWLERKFTHVQFIT